MHTSGSWVRPPRTLAAAAGLALLLLAAGAAAARPVHAVAPNSTVTSLADAHLEGGASTCVSTLAGGDCTLRAAIELNDASSGGSTIKLNLPAPGQIKLTLGQLIIEKDATITGAGHTANAVMGDGANRVLAIGPNTSVAISGLTVTGGKAPTGAGGGILNVGGLTLVDVDVQGNTAAFGGGIADAGTLALQSGDIVTANSARQFVSEGTFGGVGGGIGEFGKLVATGAQLTANTADNSGGNLAVSVTEVVLSNREFVSSGTASVSQSTVAQGTAPVGGGLLVDVGESATFAASTFVGNAATPADLGGEGGAIASICGALTLSNDTLAGNRADGFGGAIDQVCEPLETARTAAPAEQRSPHRLPLPPIQAPQAGTGGAEFIPTSTPTPAPTPPPPAATAALDFVTFADNTGGIVQGQSLGSTIANAGDLSTIIVHDTIVAKKSGDAGVDCRLDGGAKLTSQGYNLESADDCSFHATGDQVKVDPKLGALASNGGPTQTMALTAGTAAVDSADPSCDVKADQRGVSRPQGPRCDIGAFELQVATPSSPTPLPSPPVTGGGPAPAGPSVIALILALLAIPMVGVGLLIARRRTA